MLSNLTELYFYIKLPPKIKKYKKEKNKNNFTLQFQGRCDDDDDGDDDDDFFKNCWYRNFVQTRFQDPARLDQMFIPWTVCGENYRPEKHLKKKRIKIFPALCHES